MSRRDRFVRVFFKSGVVVDLVPEGSLADGFRWTKAGWKIVSPDIDELWDEWETNVR